MTPRYRFECPREGCPVTLYEISSEIELQNAKCPRCEAWSVCVAVWVLANGVDLISQERTRQIQVEGFGYKHDSGYGNDQLAWAAACYAAPSGIYAKENTDHSGILFYDPWPWDKKWDKRSRENGEIEYSVPLVRVRSLAKAGALVAAEIDLLVTRYGLAEKIT